MFHYPWITVKSPICCSFVLWDEQVWTRGFCSHLWLQVVWCLWPLKHLTFKAFLVFLCSSLCILVNMEQLLSERVAEDNWWTSAVWLERDAAFKFIFPLKKISCEKCICLLFRDAILHILVVTSGYTSYRCLPISSKQSGNSPQISNIDKEFSTKRTWLNALSCSHVIGYLCI